MKIFILLMTLFVLSGCAEKQAKGPTAAEQVAGLQEMCAKSSEAMAERQKKESLYSRLGGKERIRTFASKSFDAHKRNPEINAFFAHSDKEKVVDKLTEFLVMHSGGGGKYEGEGINDVHKNMKISYADFLSAGGDIKSVMTEMSYGENEQQEAVCFLVSFVPIVVTNEL